MDIFHTKECEFCNLKFVDADFKTHYKDCHEEAEEINPSNMCIEVACDEVFAGE